MRRSLDTGLLVLVLLMSLASAGRGAAEVLVPLQFIPKEDPEHVRPTSSLAVWKPISLGPIIDSRQGDQSLLGENREKATPVPVIAQGSLATLASEALRKSLSDWGARLDASASTTLSGEILELSLVETDRYRARVEIRFTLSIGGATLWEGVVTGTAERRGRSLKPVNYNETVSDALVRASSRLASDAAFVEALSGNPARKDAGAGTPPNRSRPTTTIDPGRARDEILRLRRAGLDDGFVADFAAGLELTRALSAEDILEWRAAGVPDHVLRAVVSGHAGSPRTPPSAASPAASPSSVDTTVQAPTAVRTGTAAPEARPPDTSRPGKNSVPVPALAPGFLDLRWGDPPQAAMSPLRSEGSRSTFQRPADPDVIGGVPVRSIQWEFSSGHLFRVVITISRSSFEKLVRELTGAWGPAESGPRKGAKAHWQKVFPGYPSTLAEVRVVDAEARLVISQPEMAAEANLLLTVTEDL